MEGCSRGTETLISMAAIVASLQATLVAAPCQSTEQPNYSNDNFMPAAGGLSVTAYESGHLGDALVFFELLQYFEEFDAAWKGQLEQYTKNLSNDPDRKSTRLNSSHL